jgi:hypothetical protein
MGLIPAKYRSSPWSWTKDPVYLAAIKAESERDGVARGIFFDTSGNARIEVINPNAHCHYLWRSDDIDESCPLQDALDLDGVPG